MSARFPHLASQMGWFWMLSFVLFLNFCPSPMHWPRTQTEAVAKGLVPSFPHWLMDSFFPSVFHFLVYVHSFLCPLVCQIIYSFICASYPSQDTSVSAGCRAASPEPVRWRIQAAEQNLLTVQLGCPGSLWLLSPRPPRLVSISMVSKCGIRDRIGQCFTAQTLELSFSFRAQLPVILSLGSLESSDSAIVGERQTQLSCGGCHKP